MQESEIELVGLVAAGWYAVGYLEATKADDRVVQALRMELTRCFSSFRPKPIDKKTYCQPCDAFYVKGAGSIHENCKAGTKDAS